MNLTRIAVNNPVFATMMMVAFMVLGTFSYRQLGIEQYPNVDFPVVVVSTLYPGASPETVETEVSRKIEEQINSIAGVKNLTSRSYEGQSVVIAEFELSVASALALQDVREKVQQVRATFRDEVKEPLVLRFNPDDIPIVSVAIRSDIRSKRDLTTIADRIVLKRLETVRGVGKVTIVGGVKRQINIQLNPERLQALRVGLNEVLSAIRTENQNFPAGNVTRHNDDKVIEIDGRVVDPKRFADLIVARRGNAPVYLGQVAEIIDGEQERESVALLNGAPAIAIDVVKSQGTNTIEIADGVRRTVAELMKNGLPSDVRLDIVVDTSRGIRNSVDNVQRTLIEGGLLTVAIVFLFLHSWRSTIITGLALPVSVLGAFIVLALFGFTLNIMTLMALSLVIGILIDDAIVVRENITRHLAMGKSHHQAALDGTNEIGLAVLATTFTIVAVFLPVAFMGGIIGRFFFQFGVMVSAAVLISLFVSFTLDPMLSSVWHDPQAHGGGGRFARALEAVQRWLAVGYRHLLSWALNWRKTTLAVALVAFIGSFGLVPLIGVEFVPEADLGEQIISIETPTGSSLEYTAAKLRQVDAAVRSFSEIAYTYGSVNTGYVVGKNQASLYVRYKDLSQRKRSPAQVSQPIRERLAAIPGIIYSVTASSGPGGAQKLIQVSLQGPDMVTLDRLSRQVMDMVAKIPGTVDIDRNLKAARPILSVKVKRDVASDLGVNSALVAETVRPLFAGDETSLWKAPDGENYTVMVRLPLADRAGREDLDRIWLATGTDSNGAPRMVQLSQIASITTSVGASQINRRDLQREVQITANVAGRAGGEVSRDLQQAIAQIKLPPGYRFVFTGSTRDMQESAAYAGQALLMAVILIYLILASQFGSFLQPLAIMLSLPLSLIGVFLGLLIAGTTLNLFSAIGFIMLMGLVTKNAILLVDFANQARIRGVPIRDALLEAGTIRLRPILMTTLAMIFGMIPLALGLGEGGSQRAPMAHAVIGGLISSTLLTLIVVPVSLIYIDRVAVWGKRRFSRSADEQAGQHGGHAKPAE